MSSTPQAPPASPRAWRSNTAAPATWCAPRGSSFRSSPATASIRASPWPSTPRWRKCGWRSSPARHSWSAPGKWSRSGAALSRKLADAGVTVLSCVPTLLAMMDEDVPTVRLLILGGEACPPDLVKRWWRPGRRVFNTYGPTEATVIATCAECHPDEAGYHRPAGAELPGLHSGRAAPPRPGGRGRGIVPGRHRAGPRLPGPARVDAGEVHLPRQRTAGAAAPLPHRRSRPLDSRRASSSSWAALTPR